MQMPKEWLDSAHLLVLALFSGLGAFAREILTWLRGARRDRAEIARSDLEVGRALRDELHAEIERLRAELHRQDAECQLRLEALEASLKTVRLEAEQAAEEAHAMRREAERLGDALKDAQAMIRTLKRQVQALSKSPA